MSLRKLCFYAILATIFACAAAGRFNRRIEESDALKTNASPNRLSLAGDFRAKSEPPLAVVLPIQSKNAKSLAAGKLLVASRNLGDPHFAKTVILLVRCDAQGVLGLILNRRTGVPLSRALGNLKAAKDRSDPVYLGGPVETPAVFALFQSPGKIDGAEQIFDDVYLLTRSRSSNKPFPLNLTPASFMFIWATPDGLKINCERKWNWAHGSCFRRKRARCSIRIRIRCGWK